MKSKIHKILGAITLCVVAFTSSLRAEQGGSGHYISGQFVDFSGMPPSDPGLYVANYFVDYGNGSFGGSKQLPFGGIFAANVTANLNAEVPIVIYTYPFCVQNIHFSSGIVVPWVWVDVKAGATFDRNRVQISGSAEQKANGLGDIMAMPIAASWTNGDFKVGSMFNVWAPSGNYTPGQLANPGLGYWTFEPMAAFSWFSTKIGTEFTVFPAVDFNTENTKADYTSGDLFHVDATLAQHLPLFGGVIGAGASTSYIKQFTGDTGSGAKLGSFEAESVSVGPTVSYIHSLGKVTLIVDGSWLAQVKTVNTPKGNYFWAKITFAF